MAKKNSQRSAKKEKKPKAECDPLCPNAVAIAKNFGFNWLERLLVFCPRRSRSVPAESGVRFQVSSKVRDEALCLLFRTDREERDELLFGRDEVRPDYLVLHARNGALLWTIVEMKGNDEKDHRHGIEQMRSLRDRLWRECREHLPGALVSRMTIQGLLLTPTNARPLKEVVEQKRQGFSIVQLGYQYRAELYPYVSKKIDPERDAYKHESLPRTEPELGFLEQLFLNIERRRPHGPFAESRQMAHADHHGLFLLSSSPGADATATVVLSVTSKDAQMSLTAAASHAEIQKHLAQRGLTTERLALKTAP